ncbi:unnamed protein product [Heligmosomoides polygyrus]|uniref:Hook C-terminal domain-containing protein n=1 Tax=Heligmosomoides polygyrus TaxID=6339 RepID=A0A3P8DFD7_HELPZ|nr:unnamed protein product [Heligmosomoides polygyrus]
MQFCAREDEIGHLPCAVMETSEKMSIEVDQWKQKAHLSEKRAAEALDAQLLAEGGLSRHEFDSLRREIEQKDRRIKQLEEQAERTNTMHEQEQRLLTTAFYGMAKRVDECSRMAEDAESARERSFLSRQKQANAFNLRVVLPWFLVLLLFGYVVIGDIRSSTRLARWLLPVRYV